MAFIDWTKDLSVGSEEIDSQHKELINMINEFYNDIMKKSSRENIIELVKKMADYSVYHFATEERYMKEFNFDGYEKHKEEHDKFVAQVIVVSERIKQGRLVVSFEITTFLKNWIKGHIKGTDKLYITCFKDNGVK